MRPLWQKLVLFGVMLVLAISCRGVQSEGESITVNLGFSAWPGWLPWQVTQEKGIFSQNKVAVALKWFESYTNSLDALIEHNIDANSQTLNDTIISLGKGSDQVIVLVNDNSTGNDQVIVRAGIDEIKDLRGKRIGVEFGTVDHFLLGLGLKQAGLEFKDVEIVPMETSKAAQAFLAGRLDAVAVFAPFTTEALKRPGSKTLFSSRDFRGAISDHLVFSRRFIDKHPEEVQRVIDSWFATLNFIESNPESAIEILAKRAGVSVDEYKAYADGTRIFSLPENIAAFQKFDDMSSLHFAARKITEFLKEVKLLTSEPDLERLFDDRFIRNYAERAQGLNMTLTLNR
ncbi:MAG: ABC transporter substrate-binding protein [Chloroherpetonaceae bacterium]|nr:ABC transporter substrate-binding protein [Chloroherpetonaceae bacterium]